MRSSKDKRKNGIEWRFSILHYEAKLCFSRNVSKLRKKDAPFILILFFHFVLSFRHNFNRFIDLSQESRNKQTQNCVPIQCTVWPQNIVIIFKIMSIKVGTKTKSNRKIFAIIRLAV